MRIKLTYKQLAMVIDKVGLPDGKAIVAPAALLNKILTKKSNSK